MPLHSTHLAGLRCCAADSDSRRCSHAALASTLNPVRFSRILLTLAALLTIVSAQAATTIGPWIPKFKGVDFSVSSNTPPGGDFVHRQVVYAFRIDLTDPDIRLFTTPRIASNYIAGAREIGGLTVSDFLRTNHVQAAINANFFSERNYYLPAGYPMDVFGLAISQGVVVSPQDGPDQAAVIAFDKGNRATIINTNWPAGSVDGMYTAVSGNYPLVIAGKSVVSRTGRLDTDPRTAYGLSQDRRYLFLVGIDGRQPGYSDGAYDYETAAWLLLLGASDGVNMDGGGSTTLVLEDSTGVPLRLNKPSAVADSRRERTVGSHLGIFAKPLPGFINDVAAVADDNSAKITWTTVKPSTSEVQYGLTDKFGESSGVQSDLVTQHSVQLQGLTPNTGYYYRIAASDGSQQYLSPNFYFVTTNYVTTNQIFEITNSWKYTTASPTSLSWMASSFDDSVWSGPAAGLLWVDTRPAGANSLVEPKGTQMPADPSTGYPYITYYFRTHFTLDRVAPGTSLTFSGFIDDGAVFYLNGAEIYRLRMPAVSSAQTLASAYPCDGDATCPDEFSIPASSLKNLAAGDNVLAVEVHNYNTRSADITFGVSLARVEPVARVAAKLDIRYAGATINLTWEDPAMVLQSAETPLGPWLDVEGTQASPFIVVPTQSSRFYRLRK